MPVKDSFKSLEKKALLIKLQLVQWLSEPKPLNRVTFYFALFIIVSMILHLIFSYLDLLHTHADSARYMLSALVQGEAAIVALVVTLSLVVVQLAAQSYSVRVTEVFRRTPDLWILIGIYGISIFFGLIVLKLVDVANPKLCSGEYICLSNLEINITFTYYLGVFSFVALVPYIWKTTELLKPSIAINILAKEINKKNILLAVQEKNSPVQEEREMMRFGLTSSSYHEEFPRIEKDPILPIIDIVRKSLMNLDSETVKEGLKAIRERIDGILSNEKFTDEEEKKVSIYVFNHLIGIGRLAVSKNDEFSLVEVINCMKIIGVRGAKNSLPNITCYSIYYLKKIFDLIPFFQFERVIKLVVDSLEYIGRHAAKTQLDTAIERAEKSLEKVVIALAESKSKYSDDARHALRRLKETT